MSRMARRMKRGCRKHAVPDDKRGGPAVYGGRTQARVRESRMLRR